VHKADSRDGLWLVGCFVSSHLLPCSLLSMELARGIEAIEARIRASEGTWEESPPARAPKCAI